MPRSLSRRLLVLAGTGAVALALLLSAAPAQAAGTSVGTVSGHVAFADGSAAAGIPVALLTTYAGEYRDEDAPPDPTHSYVFTATSDAAGDYTVDGVQAGTYWASVAPNTAWVQVSGSRATVAAGGTAAMTTLVVSRVATLHGTLVAAEDGAPVAGADVILFTGSAGERAVRSVADGGFTIHAPPGAVMMQISAADRFVVTLPATAGAGEDVDLGTVRLAPAGTVAARVLSRTGHPIRDDAQRVIVDGCTLVPGLVSTCDGAAITGEHGVAALYLAPGAHTLRYEVRAPLSSAVQRVTRSVTVSQARTTSLAPVVFRADPTWVEPVEAGTYRRGRPMTVRVLLSHYTDGTQPRLRTTFLVDGHAVAPTSTRLQQSGSSSTVLVAVLPARWSSARSRSVQAVEHGTAAYTGSTSEARKLVRRG